MWFLKKFKLMRPDGGDVGSSGGAGDAGAGDAGGADGGDGSADPGASSADTGAAGGADGGAGKGDGGAGADSGAADKGAKGAADKGSVGKDGKAAPTWPEDWQSKMSKGDAKREAALKRYASPEALADALIAAQTRIRSGELKTALPKDASADELKAWRTENGIPESPEKYDLTFDSGLVIGAQDKPVIDGFLKNAHNSNLPPEAVKSTIEWYYGEQERQTQERLALDEKEAQAGRDTLNAEYGAGFRKNMQAMEGLLMQFPESVRADIKGARMPNGTGLFNNPDVIRGFVALALEVNPAGTLVPSGGGDPMKGIDGRIEEIKGMMAKDRVAYNKNEKVQAEYRELLAAREKMAARK